MMLPVDAREGQKYNSYFGWHVRVVMVTRLIASRLLQRT